MAANVRYREVFPCHLHYVQPDILQDKQEWLAAPVPWLCWRRPALKPAKRLFASIARLPRLLRTGQSDNEGVDACSNTIGVQDQS